MTTNGVALSRLLPSLHAAGLDKLNLSLDTLQRGRFLELTRRDALAKVLHPPPPLTTTTLHRKKNEKDKTSTALRRRCCARSTMH